jgi:LmbE family N-acetylglucosaminyl deacetylase
VFNDDPTRRRITEVIRAAAPGIVLAPSPADYHPDHEAVSVLVHRKTLANVVTDDLYLAVLDC